MRMRRMIWAACIGAGFAGPALSQEPINGRWAIDPQGCRIDGDSSETASLYIAARTIKWWVADCRIGKSYKVGNALYIQARCSNEGARHSLAAEVPDALASAIDAFLTRSANGPTGQDEPTPGR